MYCSNKKNLSGFWVSPPPTQVCVYDDNFSNVLMIKCVQTKVFKES